MPATMICKNIAHDENVGNFLKFSNNKGLSTKTYLPREQFEKVDVGNSGEHHNEDYEHGRERLEDPNHNARQTFAVNLQ